MRRTSKSPCIAYVTLPALQEARKVASALLKKKLVACVNILPRSLSMYRWEGKIVSSQEYVLVAKTRLGRCRMVKTLVRSMHSYDCPCVVFLEIADGESAFLRWIESETR